MYRQILRNKISDAREILRLKKQGMRPKIQVLSNHYDFGGIWQHLQDIDDHHLRESHQYWMYPDNWPEIRARILRRDRYRCVICGKGGDAGPLHVHHIVWVSRGGSHEDENLETRCVKHHADAHPGNARLRAMAERRK